MVSAAKVFGTPIEIHAFRSSDRALDGETAQLITRQIYDGAMLDSDYDILFITNPTSLHYITMKSFAERTRHMFIEKPVFDRGDYCLSDLHLRDQSVYYVAGPLRYSPVIERLRKLAAEERIYCARVICTSYLPDWRPGTDYSKNYSARKELGGGVAIDLIHEWDYLVSLFGFPQKVFSISGRFSHLEIDSEDLAVYIAEYHDKAVELHLDYFGRVSKRNIELFTKKGVITGDLLQNCITFTDGRSPVCFEEEKNTIYRKEMEFFMKLIFENKHFNNIAHCQSVLNIALGKAEGVQPQMSI